MEIQIPDSGPFIPSVTFRELGQGLDYLIVSSEQIQDTVFGTGELATWDDGNPKMKTVNTGIVISGNAKVSEKDEAGNRTYRDLEPGELVKVFMKGATEKAWKEAARAAGKVSVGDKVRDIHDDTRANTKNPSYNPTKLHSISISSDVDPAQRAEAEAKAKELAAAKATPVDTPAPAPAPAASGGASWGEDPF